MKFMAPFGRMSSHKQKIVSTKIITYNHFELLDYESHRRVRMKVDLVKCKVNKACNHEEFVLAIKRFLAPI